MRLRVYIAAPLAQAGACRLVASDLRAAGARVVSTWHATKETVDPSDVPTREAILKTNLDDLNAADVLVAMVHEGVPRGALVELGIALGRGLRVVWVQGPNGEGANIFDCHTLVTRVASVGDAVNEVRRLAALAGNDTEKSE